MPDCSLLHFHYLTLVGVTLLLMSHKLYWLLMFLQNHEFQKYLKL
jgi:hypothetical protein